MNAELESKLCKTCGEILPHSMFYADRTKTDRLGCNCKACVKRRQAKWKSSARGQAIIKAQIARLSDKRRGNPDYLELRSLREKKRRVNGVYPNERERRHVAKYRAQYPEKERAKQLLNNAVLSGTLKRPSECESCRSTPLSPHDGRAAIHGHHDDYSKPLDVRWLCAHCHALVHRALIPATPAKEPE